MRERTRSEDLKIESYELLKYIGTDLCNNAHENFTSWQTHASGQLVTHSKSEVMHDVITPNFHKLCREGKIVNSPMDRTITETWNQVCDAVINHETATWNTSCTPDQWTRYTQLFEGSRPSTDLLGDSWLPDSPSIDVESLIDQAVTSAHANVSQTNAQGLVMAAEGRKTVEGLASIFLRLIRIIRKVKRLDVKGLLGELSPKELADRYMELRYALRPLMYDMRDVVSLLSQEANAAKRLRQTFRGYATQTAKSDDEADYVVTWSGAGSPALQWYRTATVKQIAQRAVHVRAGVLSDIEKRSGFAAWGLLDPVEAVWELVPFSFIVDWFFNVGDTISSFTPNYGIKELASWYVVTDICYRESALLDSDAYSTGGDATHRANYIEFSVANCKRAICTTQIYRVPDPTRSVIPTFSLNLDAFKLADLVIIAKKIWG